MVIAVFMSQFLEGLEGFTMAPFTRALGWSVEEVQVLCAKVRSEMLQRKIHGWQKGYVLQPSLIALKLTFMQRIVCYGQKPLDTR